MLAVAPGTPDADHTPGGNVGDAGPAPAATPATTTAPATTSSPPTRFAWHVTGKSRADVAAPPIPNADPVAFLYEQDAGLYPRFWGGKEWHGGIPQRANLSAHLDELTRDIQRDIPDPNFNGWAVIDYEAWEPVWELTKPEYREASIEHTRRASGPRPEADIQRLAKASYESAARRFLLETIRHCKKTRPRAKWGFYAWPWPTSAPHLEQMRWMWDASDAVYPCVYTPWKSLPPGETPTDKLHRAAGDYDRDLRARITLAERAANGKPVVPIIWVRYDGLGSAIFGQFVTDADLDSMLRVPRELGVDAVIFWNQAQDPREAADLQRYIDQTLTPKLRRLRAD